MAKLPKSGIREVNDLQGASLYPLNVSKLDTLRGIVYNSLTFMDTMTRMTILIVDDDENMAAMMHVCLQRGGFHVLEADSGADALRLVEQHSPQLVIADMVMPDVNGYELLRKIRLHGSTSVFLMVIGARSLHREVFNLGEGMDDYIRKPFSEKQLLARVKALLRHAGESTHLIKRGPLTLDKIDRQVACDGNTLKLSRLEFQLLSAFMERPRHIFTREELFKAVWKKDYEGNSRALDTAVATLHRKLTKRDYLIVTVRGVGYKLDV